MKRELTQELLNELLRYEPATGNLYWRERDRRWFKTDRAWRAWNARFAGRAAGTPHIMGYVQIAVLGQYYLAHRIIWKMVHGHDPIEVDHENHVKDDNRILNLKEVDHAANSRNNSLYLTNKSGVPGVWWYERIKRWHVHIAVNGKRINVGYYKNKDEAVAKRIEAERSYGYHKNNGMVAA